MEKTLFSGVCTALVTPFLEGKINYPMLETLLDRQIASGIGCVVLCGTTGESPTLSDAEKISLFSYAKKFTGNRCSILAGTGSNNTKHVVDLSRAAEDAGADGLLVVSPYYNKATSDGLYEHYSAVASSVHIPVIIYNVPSRTGQDIPVEVYQRLSQIPNIVGVKEASTDIKKFLKIKAVCPSDFTVWSGNDDMIVPAISLGSAGVISVISNVYPTQAIAMADAALNGDFSTAAAIQIQMQPFIELLFSEVNPIPVKAAMKLIGYDCGECRLPLTSASEKLLDRLKSTLVQ